MEQTSNVHTRMKVFGMVRPSSDVFAVVFALKGQIAKKKSPLARFLCPPTDL